jgi:putative transposase
MIRCSEHILKYQTDFKSSWLDLLFSDYKKDLQYYIDLLWDKKLPLTKMLSSKVLPANNLEHSQYKQILYKQASEMIRANIEKKKTSKPIIKNLSIDIDERLFDILPGKEFEEFIHLRLPYFRNKSNAYTIRLPIRHHKHSRKFKVWTRSNTIKLKQNLDGQFYVIFTYEKEDPPKRTKGKAIGYDQGYHKLLASSNFEAIGLELEKIYNKICKKVQGSKNFKDSLVERDKLINEVINKIDLTNVKQIILEKLKFVKDNSNEKLKRKLKNGKITKIHYLRYKKFANKLQRWCYSKVVNKLKMLCEENGILLTFVNPAYTSQTCSQCGSVHKESRQGLIFKCIECGFETDADFNAAVEILHRGEIIPLLKEIDNIR